MSKKVRSDAPLQVAMLLYVLECEPVNNKPTFYIGVSYCLNNRLSQHTSNRGSQWTRLHKPVRIAECRMNATLQMEREVTLHYMRKYGWRQVRGGPWSKAFMKRPPRELRDAPGSYVEAAKSAGAAESKQPVSILQV